MINNLLGYILQGGILSALIALVGFAWSGARSFVELELQVKTIATNDLPHIYGELRDLRESFTKYLIEK